MVEGREKAVITMAGANPQLGELFCASALMHNSSISIEYQGRHVSYGQLYDRVSRTTSMLTSQDLRRGHCVALLSRNRPEFLEVNLADANLGVEGPQSRDTVARRNSRASFEEQKASAKGVRLYGALADISLRTSSPR